MINREFWTLLSLLVLVVIVPTVFLLWFMSKAVSNEHLAVRQRLTEFYRSQLSNVQSEVKPFWDRKRIELSLKNEKFSEGERFANLVKSGAADSVVVFNRDGRLMYPVIAHVPLGKISDEWANALAKEYKQNDPAEAAKMFERIITQTNDTDDRARVLQAQIRNLVKAGQKQEALRIITDELTKKRYIQSLDLLGRLITPNAQLLALQLINKPSSILYKNILKHLASRVNDYSDSYLPSSQRLFLMQQLMNLDQGLVFPTLNAEIILNEKLSLGLLFSKTPRLTPVLPSQLYQLTSQDGSTTGYFLKTRIINDLERLINSHILLPEVTFQVRLRTTPMAVEPLFNIPLGQTMPDWELRVYHSEDGPLTTSTEKQILVYFWTAFLVIGGIVILVILIATILLKQLRSAQLKNDFVATVSHELKTPLASIRLFVDTLLEDRIHDEHQVKEYLEIISKENLRLSRLIDNFLTFSKMERNKYSFQPDEINPEAIVNLAVEHIRERHETSSCVLFLDIAPNLPTIKADKDAMVTVMLNILDNAFKYSKMDKRILIKLYQDGPSICFQTEDNGIGLSSRDVKKVFNRFYQADQSLSRQVGGCGLGLSIVHFIVKAHKGSINVESEMGKGSVFTIKLPRHHTNRKVEDNGI